jgi:hypothetical protein
MIDSGQGRLHVNINFQGWGKKMQKVCSWVQRALPGKAACLALERVLQVHGDLMLVVDLA